MPVRAAGPGVVESPQRHLDDYSCSFGGGRGMLWEG